MSYLILTRDERDPASATQWRVLAQDVLNENQVTYHIQTEGAGEYVIVDVTSPDRSWRVTASLTLRDSRPTAG